MTNYPPEVTEARQLYRAGKQQESRDRLRDFLLQQPAHLDALLWLAKVTPDHQEAIAAAELALKLDPGNEVAQRAVNEVRKRAEEPTERAPEQTELSAAVALSTGMTLTQARAVKWPFRGINRPIGEALDDGTITLRDLGWAVEKAWDARMRDAAKTILLAHLIGAEPKELPPPVGVITGSDFSEWQERKSLAYSAMLAGAVMLLAVEVVIASLAIGMLPRGTICWAALALCVVMGLGFIGMRFMNRYIDQAEQYRIGRWGEEEVLETLRYALDGRWTIFRNFEWTNRRWGDVDVILVGPGGVWVFEVKAYSGRIRNVGDGWQRKTRLGWRKLTTHPGHQARENAARLKTYLNAHGTDVPWVEPAVIWAGESGTLAIEDPATPVWSLKALPDRVEELWQSRYLSEETVQQVVDVLNRAVQAAKE